MPTDDNKKKSKKSIEETDDSPKSKNKKLKEEKELELESSEKQNEDENSETFKEENKKNKKHKKDKKKKKEKEKEREEEEDEEVDEKHEEEKLEKKNKKDDKEISDDKKYDSKVEDVHTANNWEEADLGDDQRKLKFLKLMGAFKHKSEKEVAHKHARDATETKKISQELEKQFNEGISNKFKATHHLGLGFSSDSGQPEKPKKPLVQNKHTTFDDDDNE